MAGAALAAVWGMAGQVVAGPLPPSVAPVLRMTEEAPAEHPEWLPAALRPLPADGKSRALWQLETAGLAWTGDTFVHAVRLGHQPLIDLFLSSGIDVNAAGPDGRTPLLVAGQSEDWPLFARLLQAGADANRADSQGVTPLMTAAWGGNCAALRSLLDRGADLDAVDQRGHRAVHYAAAGGGATALTFLLDRGAKWEGPCCEKHDLLEHACEQEDWSVIAPVLQRQTTALPWRNGSRKALEAALAERHEEAVRMLLAKHTGAPTPAGRAQPLLAWAIANDKLEDFKFLLQCGADPNTLLNSPVEKAFSETVRGNYLRHYLESEPGMTALMLAAGMGKTEYVKLLLEKGAKRGQGTAKLRLPAVLFAAPIEAVDVMQMLIESAPKPDDLQIVISLREQRATVLRGGVQSMQSRVSTGRAGRATPKGRYVVTDKDIDHRSTIYKCPMPFFMRLNGRDFGMHEGNLPGYPASHGCIRMPGDMARRFYKEIPIGTLVTITD